MILLFLPLIVVGYLLGSIPFGVLISHAKGKDLRSIGSGNIGATNVARALGRKWAYLCFALDVLKGLIPMLAAIPLTSKLSTTTEASHTVLLCLWLAVGCSAIVGHIFPVYLRFKGGKGVATSLGVVLGLYPYFTIAGVIAFAVWGAFVLIWRYVSLASIAAAIAFPAAFGILIALQPEWKFTILWPLFLVAVVMAAMVVIRHVENIKRLLEGSESKVLQN